MACPLETPKLPQPPVPLKGATHLASCDRMSVAGGSGHTYPEARLPTRRSSKDVLCCGAGVRFWHIATLRGNATLRSLSERSGHGAVVFLLTTCIFWTANEVLRR